MAEQPYGVQLRRTAGWRMPPNTMSVARPHRWGNPIRVVLGQMVHSGDFDDDGNIIEMGPWCCKLHPDRDAGWWFDTKREAQQKAVDLFELRLTTSKDPHWVGLRERIIPDLRWKNLACFCGLDDPCHRNVLLRLANGRMKP